MKKMYYTLFTLVLLVILGSCKEDEEKMNFFSFKGKEYTINETGLFEIIANQGTDSAASIYMLYLGSISGGDTTTTLFTLFDSESNELGGNYPSIDMSNETATRAIIPFAFLFNSGIGFQDGTFYFTGEGGSIDIVESGNNYEISINNVSAGDYRDIFDSDPYDGDYEYTESGKISGIYKGTIVKQTEVLSLSIKNRIEKIQKSILVK